LGRKGKPAMVMGSSRFSNAATSAHMNANGAKAPFLFYSFTTH
jgi:hypothetical protein